MPAWTALTTGFYDLDMQQHWHLLSVTPGWYFWCLTIKFGTTEEKKILLLHFIEAGLVPQRDAQEHHYRILLLQNSKAQKINSIKIQKNVLDWDTSDDAGLEVEHNILQDSFKHPKTTLSLW